LWHCPGASRHRAGASDCEENYRRAPRAGVGRERRRGWHCFRCCPTKGAQEVTMTTAHGKILLIDDDPKLRLALHHTLQMLGFDMTEASNGEQALQETHNQHFDAVLLDMNMPGMGGIETCRALRRSAPRLHILMLTVRDSEADKVQALDAGADDYV